MAGPITSSLDKPLPEQLRAADPSLSVWVSAAAGTGKTRILVDRLLRLLLQGVHPSRILCITFTKAAAGQIEDRIRHRLMEWAVQDAPHVTKDLTALLGHTPDAALVDKAKHLFSGLLNIERPLAIQTIHSFCQSVLARFPLEANLLPGFAIASDPQSALLRQQAFQATLTGAVQKPTSQQAVTRLFGITDRKTILGLLSALQHDQEKWFQAQPSDFLKALHTILQCPYPYTLQDHLSQFLNETQSRRAILQNLVLHLQSVKSGVTGPRFAEAIIDFLNHPGETALDTYSDAILTEKGTINSNLAKVAAKLDDAVAIDFTYELERVLAYRTIEAKLRLIERNHDILTLAHDFVGHYNHLKQQQALLDYDDQIQMTARLLTTSDQASWVMYKLDGGIQHLLLDEAQDTSPAQWRIVKALIGEMTSGSGRFEPGERSVFIVGDEKQSIYSFQDADIQSYQDTRIELNTLFKTNGLPWADIQLTTNFRSSPAILSTTDGIFADPYLKKAITHEETVHHTAFFQDRSGRVEAWPLFASEDMPTEDDYLPVTVVQERKATQKLCQDIAGTIGNWLKTKRVIPRLGRAVKPGDILILLQRRNPLLNPLIKALKDLQIPVAGVDRMILTEQLIVQDMIALLQILLQPHDDLTMAALLKSPLFAISEQDLFDLSYKRDGLSLYQRLQDNTTIDPAIRDYLADAFKAYTQGCGPYQLLSRVVNRPCPADAASGRHALIKRLGFDAEDALNELLNAALAFEQDNSPDVQMFLHWLRQYDAEIKRDVSGQQQNTVRIMTVHGAKGLQAPIVFLADASATQTLFNSQRDLLWADNVPFWTSKPGEDSALNTAYAEHAKAAIDEYYRLLYVALTRAEDELYVTGYQDSTNRGKEYVDWHSVVRNYLERQQTSYETENGPVFFYSFAGSEAKTITHDAKAAAVPRLKPADVTWLHHKPPFVEQISRTPLRPSHLPFEEPPALSPLIQQDTGRFIRGTLIHKILQYLVAYSASEQADALRAMLAYPEFALNDREQAALYNEIYQLISATDNQFIFAAQEQASTELLLAGRIRYNSQDYPMTGKIDRLVYHDGAWWIIDYKTNRPPATDVESVPDAYLFQMAAYRALLQQLYPGQTIHAVLVWTHTASVMRLPADKLDQIMPLEIAA